jgi:type VI secretion system protein ImpL
MVAPQGAKGAGTAPAVQKIRTDATRVPAPLAPALNQVATNAIRIQGGDARTAIAEAWKAQVLPFCTQALENRYPLVRSSNVDVTIDDFSRLFAPGGLIDNFFNANLKPFVDTSHLPWRWQKADDIELHISNDVLQEFQRASVIRDLLFSGGKPSLKVQVTPVALDPAATQVLLEVNGQTLTYSHGPPRPGLLEWPGTLASEGRLALQPAQPGQASSITKRGPWSLFRLFDQARIEQGAYADKARMTFDVGGRKVTYDLQANSVINPLTMKELAEFRCPKSF